MAPRQAGAPAGLQTVRETRARYRTAPSFRRVGARQRRVGGARRWRVLFGAYVKLKLVNARSRPAAGCACRSSPCDVARAGVCCLGSGGRRRGVLIRVGRRDADLILARGVGRLCERALHVTHGRRRQMIQLGRPDGIVDFTSHGAVARRCAHRGGFVEKRSTRRNAARPLKYARRDNSRFVVYFPRCRPYSCGVPRHPLVIIDCTVCAAFGSFSRARAANTARQS